MCGGKIDIFRWLECKRDTDGAEGLWRIHDILYDLTDFIDRHPGGSDWLELTKGTDITELFESHHISLKPEILLPTFQVREAKEPRNFKFTFKDDGFYRTLKRRVREHLPNIDRSPIKRTKAISDAILLLTFLGAILTAYLQSYIFGIVTAILLTMSVVLGHNFLHGHHNWRMLMLNLTLMSHRHWRITHVLSHHMYTNSYHDIEALYFQPFLSWIPSAAAKNRIQRYGSWIYGPFVYCVYSFIEFLTRVFWSLMNNNFKMFLDEFVAFLVPISMFFFGNWNLMVVLKMWLFILLVSNFYFLLIGLNATHHHPDIYHEGDAIRFVTVHIHI